MKTIASRIPNKNRQSNIELLRIFAIFLVMFGHTHLRNHPLPQTEIIYQQPVWSFFEVMCGCISTTGVGIFVAISGWFGIHIKKSGLTNYLFLVFFTLWTIYGLAIALNLTSFNSEGIKICLSLYKGFWFVIGYLGLYLLSPILNAFISLTSKREFQMVLFGYFLFQSYYSWITAWYDYYSGYSILLFTGIYLTTAYLRKYPIGWMEKHSLKLLLGVIGVTSAIATLSLWKFGHAARQIRDDNPLIIMACILFFLSFKKLKFHSRIINWLSASCFAVYLIHFNPYVYPYIMSFFQSIYAQYNGLSYCFILLLSLFILYFCCVLYDQTRKVIWWIIIYIAGEKTPKICS